MGVRRSARLSSINSGHKRNASQIPEDDELVEDGGNSHEANATSSRSAGRKKRDPTCSRSEIADTTTDPRPTKRRKTQSKSKQSTTKTTMTRTQDQKKEIILTLSPPLSSPNSLPPFPSRSHPSSYHTPLLLTSAPSRHTLLTWFDKVYSARAMPWRKPFVPPLQLPRAALAQRAYEVWISEVMLQQTRVEVVRGYWTRWMARWPTVWDLAAASEEEVLSGWAGLGYYSRAGRVHRAARIVCDGAEGIMGMGGLLPGTVDGLMQLPGVGRYTAGAVAAIVFGVAAPMVDGNVLRVLSRQMGVLGDVKGDKATVDLLWQAATDLVEAVAKHGEDEPSDRPGRWGQALMELGSTVCTPKPNCAVCPVTATCRAYAEGMALTENKRGVEVVDMEDLCSFCGPFEDADADDGTTEGNLRSQSKSAYKEGRLSRFFASQASKPKTTEAAVDARALQTIVNHAQKFPLKKPKKRVPEQETLVCAIRCASDGRYMIHRRPEKGLLAGLWELPSHILPDSNDSTAKGRKSKAVSYVAGLAAGGKINGKGATAMPPFLKHTGEIGSVPWLFSNLKLTMHVHLFELDDADDLPELGTRERWASVKEIDKESMGSGMKKCWSLVKERME